MQRLSLRTPGVSHIRSFATSRRLNARPPLVRIDNATFHRQQPSSQPIHEEEAVTNRPLFPGLTYEVPTDNDGQYWAVVGPSNVGKTTFLDILRGQYLCSPPTARRYPYLSTDELGAKDPRLRYPGRAIQYVGFDNKPGGLSGVGTYLSARYESRREVTDFSLQDFLLGNTDLNPGERTDDLDMELLETVAHDLRLHDLMKMPVSNLSNGQTRRAKIAKALLGKPELLLLDEPFMGLDPPTTVSLSPLLRKLAEKSAPRILLSLRPQDPIPDWITHVLFLKELNVAYRGTVNEVSQHLMDAATALSKIPKDAEQPTRLPSNHSQFGRRLTAYGPVPDAMRQPDSNTMQKAQERLKAGKAMGSTMRTAKVGEWQARNKSGFGAWAYPQHILNGGPPEPGEPVIEMDGVVVKYGEKAVLGGWRQEEQDKDGLVWNVRRGERWGVFGPNGSGKTTLLSMITSDHPQAYSQPMKIFGKHRLPSPGVPGLTVFELQSRIGHSSPEVHSFFPRSLSVRAAIESAFADTPLSKPKALTVADDTKIDAVLRWFQAELNPAANTNEQLFEEVMRRQRRELRPYAKPGNAESYKTAANEFAYEAELRGQQSIEWADTLLFGELPFSSQRVCLFLRAIIRQPDIIILDEAFGGMDDYVRDKCLLFLDHGEFKVMYPQESNWTFTAGSYSPRGRLPFYVKNAVVPGILDSQALIVVSHIQEEVPSSVRKWLYLPEAARVGTKDTPDVQCRIGETPPDIPESIRSDASQWADIWGMRKLYDKGVSYEPRLAGAKHVFAVLWSEENTDGLGELPMRKGENAESRAAKAKEAKREAEVKWRERQAKIDAGEEPGKRGRKSVSKEENWRSTSLK